MPAPLPAVWRALTGRSVPPDGGPARLGAAEEDAVVRAAHRLSAGLSGRRTKAGNDYLADPETLGAYLLLWFPRSRAMADAALDLAGIRSAPGLGRALDLGAGPGPVAAALVGRGFSRVDALDAAEDALRVAARVAGPVVRPRPWRAGEPLPAGPYELVTAGHLLNELWKSAPDRIARRLALLQEAAAVLAPGGRILLIEPAAHGLVDELLALRDAALAAGFSVEGPCPTQGPCPARAAGAPCHADRPWSPPGGVARLMEAARLTHPHLAFAWLLLRPPGAAAPPAPPPGLARVVSEPMLQKSGRERVVVCTPGGRFSLSAPRGGPPRAAASVWRALTRGDAVVVEAPEPREGGWGLGPESRLHAPAPGGG